MKKVERAMQHGLHADSVYIVTLNGHLKNPILLAARV